MKHTFSINALVVQSMMGNTGGVRALIWIGPTNGDE